MRKLKPCPFCGRPAEMVRLRKTNQYYPVCTGGSAGMCLLHRTPNPDEDGFIFEKDAVHVWNRRPRKKATE
jgi:hypothetical protein